MPTPLLVAFAGGRSGAWAVTSMETLAGAPLDRVPFVAVAEGAAAAAAPGARDAAWVLRGVTSNERYVTRAEHDRLAAAPTPLGRRASTRAALLPITKSAAWWELAQDERRGILEGRSRHIATGLEYIPAVARRLHHGRDLGEPFDFLTWFEFAPDDEPRFDELLVRLRATEEWAYVEREVDIRAGPRSAAAPRGRRRPVRIAFSRDPDAEREVAPLELFFDLVYVFAIGRLSHHLVAHVDVRTSAETVVLALAVFYAWRMTAWGANRLDPDPLPVRLAGPRSRVVGLAALAILAAATAPLAMIAGIAAASAVLVAVAVTDTLRDDVPPRGAPA